MTKNKTGPAKGGRRSVPSARKVAEPKSRVATPPQERADRLREARMMRDIARREAARRLGWSESRLISYESGTTQPNASELERMATTYTVDVVWLAFGDRTRDAGTSVLWIPGLSGASVPVPLGLMAGVPGPFLCVELGDSAGLGLSEGDVLVLEVEAAPGQGGLWVARSEDGSVLLGWLEGSGGRKYHLRLDVAGTAVGVSADALLGRVVATMQRVRPAQGRGAR